MLEPEEILSPVLIYFQLLSMPFLRAHNEQSDKNKCLGYKNIKSDGYSSDIFSISYLNYNYDFHNLLYVEVDEKNSSFVFVLYLQITRIDSLKDPFIFLTKPGKRRYSDYF